MAKEFSKAFYNSKVWKKCKNSYIKKVHGLCERCYDKGLITNGWIVHHKELLTKDNINDPYITLNHDKLEYLCQICHNKEHMSKYSSIQDGLVFDSDGNLIEI
jgi:hypothetical protein